MKYLAFTLSLSMVLAALLLGGCSWGPELTAGAGAGTTSATAMPAVETRGERAMRVALDQLGAPYRYGGTRPDGFDCSGLVAFSYGAVGVDTPRTTAGLWQWASPVEDDELRPGDILFFRIDGKPSHVGLYIGEERFVHAPSAGGHVSVRRLDDPFYRPRFLRGGRMPRSY